MFDIDMKVSKVFVFRLHDGGAHRIVGSDLGWTLLLSR